MHIDEKRAVYTPLEERLNIGSHAIGLLLSIAASVLLVVRASLHGNAWHIVSFSVFGASLIVLFTASTLYHRAKTAAARSRLRVFDHASIYCLIAGTYTPYMLVTLNGAVGWSLFGIVWGLALTGIVLKFFFTGKYNLASTLMYVFMGWIIIGAIKPLLNNLSHGGFIWLSAGGLAYTVGATLYGIKQIRFNHAIFHLFVLAGSICHIISVCFYLLPGA